MNASTFPDTEQHWQELHNAPSHSMGDIVKSATETLRRSPLIGIGGAAVVGFALGRLLLGGRGGAISKLAAASAIPLASKGLHEAGEFLHSHAHRAKKISRKQIHQGLEKAGDWLHALRR